MSEGAIRACFQNKRCPLCGMPAEVWPFQDFGKPYAGLSCNSYAGCGFQMKARNIASWPQIVLPQAEADIPVECNLSKPCPSSP